MNDAIPSQIDRMDTERLKSYRRLLDFYYGLQWEGRERRGERHLVFNYARVFIEKITSYLMAGISYAVEAADDDEKSEDNASRAGLAAAKKRVTGITMDYRPQQGEYRQRLRLGAV